MKKKKKKKWQRKVCFHFHDWLLSWKINYKSVQKCLWKSFKSAMWIIEAQRISKTIPGLLGTLCQHLVAARYPHKIGVQYILPTGLLAACYTTVRSSIATVTTVRCIVHVRTAGAPQVLIVFQLTFLLLFLVDGMQLGNSIKRHSTYSSLSLSLSVRMSVCLSMRDFWGVSDRSLLPMCKFPLTRNIRKVV
jgi:hypothetical protein